MRNSLSVISLAIALGIAEGLAMAILAWINWRWNIGDALQQLIASVYYHYDASLIGGLWGALWGFIDGFIFGLIIGWVYNTCLWITDSD